MTVMCPALGRGTPTVPPRNRDCDRDVPIRNTLSSPSSFNSLAVCRPTCVGGTSGPEGTSFRLWTVMNMGLVALRLSGEVGEF